MAAANKTLGRFQLADIPPAPRGIPQIEVTFDIDKNGIVSVKAKDLGTQKEQTITIQSNTSLSDEEIDRMIKEAEENAEADAKVKEEVELRNEADQAVFQTDKTIADLGEVVTDEEKQQAEAARDELKSALEGDDIEAIREKKDKLNEILQGLAMKAYEQAAASQQAAGGQEGGAPGNDDIVDAEFEEVNDDNKK